MTISYPQNSQERRPLWIAGAATAFGVLALLPWFISFGPVTGGTGGLFAAVLTSGAMAAVFFFSSRNLGTPGRLKQALFMQGVSVTLVAAGNLLRFAHALGAPAPSIPRIGEISEFVIWILGFLALIRIPLKPIEPENRWRVAIDIAISYIGMSLVLYVIWMLPGLRDALPESRHRIMFFNIMEAGNLFVLNLILVRGVPQQIRSAINWLSAAVVVDTVYLFAFQYTTGQRAKDIRFMDSAFFIDIFFYLVAGLYFLFGASAAARVPGHNALLRLINPLPFLAILGVGSLLFLSALQNSNGPVTILAAGLVLMAILLLARVVASTLESLRLAQEKAEIEQRAQSQKTEIMRRLSGGVSHVMNNLMTVVLGNAQLLRANAAQDSPDLDCIDAINQAAHDAARLAARLGLASGNRLHGETSTRLCEAILSKRDSITRLIGQKRDIVWDVPETEGSAMVAPSDAEAILHELVSNAGEATYHAGRITIRIRDEVIPPGHAFCTLPGPHSVIEVSDTGRGIAKEDLPRVVEPFFTNRPSHEGRGLGLSVVQGIVTRYRGGLQIETVEGSGSRVRIFLPLRAREEA